MTHSYHFLGTPVSMFDFQPTLKGTVVELSPLRGQMSTPYLKSLPTL
jgi:hypothetical protein